MLKLIKLIKEIWKIKRDIKKFKYENQILKLNEEKNNLKKINEELKNKLSINYKNNPLIKQEPSVYNLLNEEQKISFNKRQNIVNKHLKTLEEKKPNSKNVIIK